MKRTPTQIKRLWALVDLMKYDPDPENYDQRYLTNMCGSPSCLLGHAEARWPALRRQIHITYFGLDSDESTYIFSGFSPDRYNDTPSIAASRVIDVIEGGS